MKNKVLVVAFLLFSTILFAQSKNDRKIKKVGDLYEVTIYYDNGNIRQHGFLTNDKKLHGSWESYNKDGSKQCEATYNNGLKVGVWFYYYDGKKTKVVYDNNKIVSVEKLDTIK